MNRDTIFWLIGAILYIGFIYALVRPGSQGPVLVTNIFNSLSDLIRGSAGETYNSQTKTWQAAK